MRQVAVGVVALLIGVGGGWGIAAATGDDPEPEMETVEVAPAACGDLARSYGELLLWASEQGEAMGELPRLLDASSAVDASQSVEEMTAAIEQQQAEVEAWERNQRRLLDRLDRTRSEGASAAEACAGNAQP